MVDDEDPFTGSCLVKIGFEFADFSFKGCLFGSSLILFDFLFLSSSAFSAAIISNNLFLCIAGELLSGGGIDDDADFDGVSNDLDATAEVVDGSCGSVDAMIGLLF